MRSTSSPRADSMMIGMLECARRSRAISSPDLLGSMTSRITRSTGICESRNSAASPSGAVRTSKPSWDSA